MKKDDFITYVKSIYPNMRMRKQQNHGPAYTQMVGLKFLLNFKCIPSRRLRGQRGYCMKWKKIGDAKDSFLPHDYEAVEKGKRFVIINNSLWQEKAHGYVNVREWNFADVIH